MGDMSERLRPATVGGIPPKLEATIIEPPVKPGSGRGSGTGIPGTGTSFTPDRQPKPRKSHKVRNFVVTATAALGGGTAAFVATRGGNESSPSSTAVVTTVDIKPTSPSDPVTTTVGESSTTIHETTTTQESKPTDVIEHRDGYDVLRNGGLLYEVPSTPEFGGFEIHMQNGQEEFGFAEATAGAEKPQEVLLNDLLWTFGAQHPEFVKPEGGVDIEAYKQYLSEHNWVDTVYLADNVSEPAAHAKYPPIVRSAPLTMDFKKPMVISSGDLGQIDGLKPYEGFYEYYYPTPADDARNLMGITADGQFFYSYHSLNVSTGLVKNVPLDQSLSPYTNNLGYLLSVTAGLGYTAEDPQIQWIGASLSYAVPAGKVQPATVPHYEEFSKLVLPMSDFITPQVGGSKLFAKITS